MKDRECEGLLNKQAEFELMGKLSKTLQEDLKSESNSRMETELKLVHTYRKRNFFSTFENGFNVSHVALFTCGIKKIRNLCR